MSIILGRTLALDPTAAQASPRLRDGTPCLQLGSAKWQHVRKSGERPSADKVKRCRNAYRETELPWSRHVTECACGQAILHLGSAFATFFWNCKTPGKQRRCVTRPSTSTSVRIRKQKYG
jgi:hypothetical protein